jgi:hypothetical protein
MVVILNFRRRCSHLTLVERFWGLKMRNILSTTMVSLMLGLVFLALSGEVVAQATQQQTLTMPLSVYLGHNDMFYCLNPSNSGGRLYLSVGPDPTGPTGCMSNTGDRRCDAQAYPQYPANLKLHDDQKCYLARCVNPENLDCTQTFTATFVETLNENGPPAHPKESPRVLIDTYHHDFPICATRTVARSAIRFKRWSWDSVTLNNARKIVHFSAHPIAAPGDLPCIVGSCSHEGGECAGYLTLFWDEYY